MNENEHIKLNGVAHTILTVNHVDIEKKKTFYRKMCTFFGLTCVLDADQEASADLSETYLLYFVGGRTALGIALSSSEFATTSFEQKRSGLHHICFRVKSREDVDRFYRFATQELFPKLGGKLIHPPREGGWAPGYYSILFEDLDGIRLELNHVPGRGLLGLPTPRVQSKL